MATTIGLCHLGIETYILCCRKCKPPFDHMSLFSVFFLSLFLPLPTLLSVKQPNCNLRLPRLPCPKLLYTLKKHNLKKQKSVKLNASKMISSVLLRQSNKNRLHKVLSSRWKLLMILNKGESSSNYIYTYIYIYYINTVQQTFHQTIYRLQDEYHI